MRAAFYLSSIIALLASPAFAEAPDKALARRLGGCAGDLSSSDVKRLDQYNSDGISLDSLIDFLPKAIAANKAYKDHERAAMLSGLLATARACQAKGRLQREAQEDTSLSPGKDKALKKVGKGSNNTSGSADTAQRSGAKDINPNTGKGCVDISGTTKDLPSLNGPYVLHNFKITNTCKKSYSVTITTNAGWTVVRSVKGGSSTPWPCTDGYKGQRDCNGIASFTYK